jgi:hypothetical protein
MAVAPVRSREPDLFPSKVPGGSADRCARIRPLDIIVSVNGAAVRGRSLQELRDLILGPPGSHLTLTFFRDASSTGGSRAEQLDVQLVRGSPQYLASLSVHAPAPAPATSPAAAHAALESEASRSSFLAPQLSSPVQTFNVPLPDAYSSPPAPAAVDVPLAPVFSPAPYQQPMSQGDSVATFPQLFLGLNYFRQRRRRARTA